MKSKTIQKALPPLALAIAAMANPPAYAYTLDQLYADLATIKGINNAKVRDLATANQALASLGIPPVDVNDINAILANPQALTFVVDNRSTVTTISQSGGISNNTMDLGLASYKVTDLASFKQLLAVLKDTSSYTSNANGNILITNNHGKLVDIVSSINGSILTRGANGWPVCTTAGGASFSITSLTDGLTCMGLGSAQTVVSAVNTINQISAANFIFNRPTTEFEHNISFMRRMRQYSVDENINTLMKAKGGSSGADQYSKINEDLGLFFGAGGSFGDVDRRDGTLGYSLYRRTASLGLDYRFSDALNTGLLFNYLSSSSNLNSSAGSFYSDIFRVAPYLSFTPFDNAFIDASVGYGYHDNSTKRNILFANNAVQGNFHAHEAFGSVNMGYSYNVQGWTLTGYGQGSAIGMYLNGYTEKGVGAAAAVNAVKVPDSYALSVTSTLGSELSYAWSTAYGVVVPRLFAEWVHEYKNNGQLISSQFMGTGLPIITKTSNPIRNWGNFGVGAQMLFQNSLTGFVNFNSLLMTGATNHTIEGGIKWAF